MDKKEKERARYRKWYEANKEHARKMKRERMREYRAANQEHYRKVSNKSTKKLKDSVFTMYGNKCAICGFTDRRALTLDHVLNNGAQERQELGERGVYRRAIEKYRPHEYRILCMNCQFIERHKHGRINQH
jgi:hypothetical protein